MLKMMRDSAVHARTKAIDQLKAILVTAAPALRETLSGLGAKAFVRRCATLPESTEHAAAQLATVYALSGLGPRILALTVEADQTERRMKSLLNEHAPKLIARTDIGDPSSTSGCRL